MELNLQAKNIIEIPPRFKHTPLIKVGPKVPGGVFSMNFTVPIIVLHAYVDFNMSVGTN